MPTKEAIENQSAKQRGIDREATGQTATGHNVSLAFDSVDTVTTVGAAGGATALPATPLGYFYVTNNGVLVKIPFYNP
jgi:hypothetical protein